ncbi:MAG: ribosomal RNA small subunit methyltransferase A, partial [Treponema sp.]|nr:ribosomal RNA small subunit methyltransferase A [Treponema sp.]
MINYNSASALRVFLDKEGLGMRKKYGQNFLINPAARLALAEALACKTGDEVWEIGPGLGAMTAILLEKGFFVHAFEIDAGFIRVLKTLFAEEKNFNLIEGDVMKTWSAKKAVEQKRRAQFLLGNLPYNIAAVLLASLIEQRRLFKRIVVTVQREVARRMAAKPGSADYSSFSVLCASAYHV